MIRALITGILHSDPQTRTSANDKVFTTAKLKADASDGGPVWCSLIAFGEQAERLATLKAGAAISVAGRCKLSAWTDKNGNPAAGLDLVVDELATLKGKPRPPQGERDPRPHPPSQRAKPAPAHGPAPRPGFNDELPEFM